MMNPILDIFAAAQSGASPTPVGIATNGPSSGDGLFAQLLADVAAGAPQSAALPIPILAGKGLSGAEISISPDNLAELAAVSSKDGAVGEILTQELIENKIGTTMSGAASVVPQPQVGSDIIDGEGKSTAIGTIVPREPGIASLSKLIGNGMPQVQESRLKSLIEAELSSLTGTKANGAKINATVVLLEDAAKALADAPAEAELAGSSVPKGEALPIEQKSMSKLTDGISSSLKGNLRRAFPSLNIATASGKADVQLKLTDSNAEAQVKADTPTTSQTLLSTNGLPIAAAPQIATAVLAAGRATPSIRPAHKARVAGETSGQSTAKSPVEGEAPVREGIRVAMRKSVQVALQSQGFDIEKLMSSDGGTKDLLAENIAIDKTDFKVTVDKQVQQATEKSVELNGAERFKLEIKRGHIEALLKRGEIKLQLQPEHLGNLKIRLMTTPTEVNARLETSSEDAKRAVELSLPQLRESFERAGLKLNSIEVSVNDDSDSRRQHAFQQGWRGREGGMRTSSGQFVIDVPATAEISQNLYTAYGGALNLVA